MISDYVMTKHNCVAARRCEDADGLAAYTIDSHACNRVVRGGRAINEGLVEIGGFPSYPISCRSQVPRRGECQNLLVPVCLAAAHVAYGSIRMEPVFTVLGQSAALAASIALETGGAVQDVDYAELHLCLLAAGQVLACQRFGLIHVDYATQRHTPKDSAHWCREVIRNGAESPRRPAPAFPLPLPA